MNPLLICVSLVWSSGTAERPGPDLAGIPPCASSEVLTIPSSWVTTPIGSTGVELSLPPGSEEIPDWGEQRVHGGVAWRGSGLKIMVSYGHWGRTSFGDALKNACRVERAGLILIQLKKDSVEEARMLVWMVNRTGIYDSVLELNWVDSADREDALRVVQSLRVSGSQ